MGIEIEAKTKVMCEDAACVARNAVESVFKKIGISADRTEIEQHTKNLIELMGDEDLYDPYTFTAGGLEVTIYHVYFDVEECSSEGCEGYITVDFGIDGSAGDIKRVVEKLLKDIRADKYVKICE
jgi:hypothetical protein